jgi:hypothetical protein
MWQMVAYIHTDKDGWQEIRHYKIYLDKDFGIDRMNSDDGEIFAQELTIDIKNGRFGEDVYLDDIELVEVA